MNLPEIEPPTDDSLLLWVTLNGVPTSEELREFDTIRRTTSRFDGWDVYAQEIDGKYVVVVVNRARRL